ncbi:MAG: ABC transporter permease [Defluviitaleaceae bacterium]|nr:ABC transporter permease [Defluviitaleaceae bacterium]
MNMLYFIVQNTMFFAIPLMLVALGGLFSEKSGVVNIALEGKMVLGAFTGILFITTYQDSISGQPILILGLLIAMLTGMAASVFHAYAAIHLKANQIISGVALNMFAPAFAIYVSRLVTGTQNVHFINQFRIDSVPVLGSIPILGPILFQNAYITTYLGFAILALATFVLYKTKFGLRLRACGEHPQAADSVGVSVAKMRYAGVLLSGALAGIGGLIWVVPISTIFSGTVNGYGFLALAVLIFGAWKPQRILFAAFFFGLMQTVAWSNAAIDFLPGGTGWTQFYKMTPFIATLIVLAFTSKNTMAPKAAGQPYDKGGR